MIAPDDDRCADLAARDQVINALAESCALAVAQPADARGQSLVWHALSREAYPSGEDPILGKELEDEAVGASNVGLVPGEGDPPEWTASFGEQRADVRGDEPRIAEGFRVSGGARLASKIVSVVERDGTARRERDDGLAVTRHRGAGSAHVLLWIGAAEGPGVGHA